MPKIYSKTLRAKDENGEWHDVPTITSEEALRAAEDARASAAAAERSAQEAEEAAEYNSQLPVVEAMDAAQRAAASAQSASQSAQNAVNTANQASETANEAMETAEDAAETAENAVSTASAAAVAAVPANVTNWLEANVTPVGSAVTVDASLAIEGSAADAKATGDAVGYVGENVAENMLRIEPPGLGKNLFNKNSVYNLYGGYRNRSNVWGANISMMETHYIPVKESENYAFTHSSGGFVLWYKKDLSFLSYTNFTSADVYVTAPLNAAFMKTAFSILLPSGAPTADTMQVENNNVQTAYEDFIRNTCKYEAELIHEKYGIINIADSELLETDNLFDINADNILTGYYDRSNNFVSSDTLGQSDFVEVFEDYEYSFATAGTFVLWYDGQKNFITYTNVSNTTQKITPPARSKYVRGIFFLANINSYWIKCEKIKRIKDNIDNTNPFRGLKGVAFGTSLTYRAQTTSGYLQYLPELSKMTWDNQGLGSSTILSNGTQPEMLPVITNYTGWADKRVCILEGFVNDWYYNGADLGTWKDTGTTTVCGCVRYALNYILTQNANLTVYLVMDHFGKGITATTAVNGAGDTQLEFYEEIEKVALSLGIRVIREYEISEISELTPQFLLDNIHLNDLGAKQSANAIWAGMRKYYPNEIS